MKKVLVVVENAEEISSQKAIELLQKGIACGAETATVLLETEVSGENGRLAEMGSTVQYFSEDNSTGFRPEYYANLIAKAAEDFGAGSIWFATGENTLVYASRVAAKLKTTCIRDVFGLDWSGEGLVARRAAYAGKAEETLSVKSGVSVLTIKPRSFDVPAVPVPGKSAPRGLKVPGETMAMRVKNTIRRIQEEMDLGSAKIVVGTGRGAKNSEGIEFVRKFATAVNAAFGGSRAVVDAGLLPTHAQIGQTGKIISPLLYVCVGISGAVQHVAGIGHSKVILAVNKDPEAPIFKIADYGIVGDLFEVLPHLESEIKSLSVSR